MDKAGRFDKRFPMRRSLALAPLTLALLLGCGSSTSKPADGPEGEKSEAPAAADGHGEKTAVASAPEPPTTSTVKRSGDATDVPDYSLTENDCQALGRRYGDATRADQRAALNPRLTAKQREQADASIDGVVTKLETQWADTCVKSLAGKNVEHETIKCALAAKTVKAFDICLNGEKK
jgi:hypothetical protein